MIVERRKFVRIPEHAEISYEIKPDSKTGSFLTRDISQGGIRFFVHEFIPEKTVLKIRLTLKKIFFSFEAFVKVMWITEDAFNDRYEIGVEFTDMPKPVAERLIAYINYIRTSFPDDKSV